MMSNRPLILISNDDGVQAQGIRVLTNMMRTLGDVIVVAPDRPRSGASCSITPVTPLTVDLLQHEPGLSVYTCNGTPTDCLKMALEVVVSKKPDLVVSGINHGDNSSVCLHYSGTVGAVLEACMKQVPAIAYSLCTHSQQCDFSPYEQVILHTARYVLDHGLPQDVLLNVNFPEVKQLKGAKVCRIGRGLWIKELEPVSEPQIDGQRIVHGTYRLTGCFQNLEPEATDTDRWALENGYAAITPVQLDMTTYSLMDTLDSLKL
ncbi:MAG: 5'/3'-nucleotidase SurE [Prevotellaceae bacterium]|nr:5'/3'-nucleotidase SurE [Prevotellaceae bacterium]